MSEYPRMLSGRFLRSLPEELKKRERIRAAIGVILVVVMNFIAYCAPKLIEGSLSHFTVTSFLDEAIPVWPVFTVFYVLAYFQWGFFWIRMIFCSEEERYRFMSAEFVAKVIGMLFFIFFPVTMNRPLVEGTDVFSTFLRFIFAFDTPTCLFPSFHCFQSWMILRVMWITRKNQPYTWFETILSILIIASTLLIKQHLVMDAIAGILLVELVLWLEKHLPLAAAMKKIMEKLVPDAS